MRRRNRLAASALGVLALTSILFAFAGCASEDGGPGPITFPPKGDAEADAADGTGTDVTDDTSTLDDTGEPEPDATEDTADAGSPDDADAGSVPDADEDSTIEPDTADPDTDAGSQDECATATDCQTKLVGLTACDVAACVDGTCVAQTKPAPGCCVVSADCDDGNPCTIESCATPGGICTYESDPLCCEDSSTYLDAGFEGGSTQGFSVLDEDGVANVGWTVSDHRSASGSWSYYFGEPTCHTYYAGALDESCMPLDPFQGDNELVNARLVSPEIVLPVDGVYYLTFKIFSETEGLQDPTLPVCEAGGPLECYDPAIESFIDALTVYVADGGNKTVLWNSSVLNEKRTNDVGDAYFVKTTDGAFMLVASDLSSWAGKSIKLEFAFSTDEPFISAFYTLGRFPEGIYLDDIAVQSGCAAIKCTQDSECKSAKACALDECTLFTNTAGGACLALPDPACESCGSAADCDDGDECTTDACAAEVCTHTAKADCCEPETLAQQGFEGGALPQGWTASAESTITWHVSEANSKAGTWNLHFGSDVTGTYAAGDNAAKGSVTTKPLAIPASTKGASAVFELFLSTEWNAGDPPNIAAPVLYDILTIDAVDTGTGVVIPAPSAGGAEKPFLWSSYEIGGTTGVPGAPVYKTVAVNLSHLAGKTFALRFTFDSADGSNNGYEGARIDELKIATSCDDEGCVQDVDCDGVDACTTASCLAGLCIYEEIPGCCTAPTDCDDGNPCTTDACTNQECVNKDKGDPKCCFAASTSLEDFEGEATTWAFVGGAGAVTWGFVSGDDTAYAGEGALYFGNPASGTYDAGTEVKGTALSPEFTVGSGGTSVLSFMLKLSTEFDEDEYFDFIPVDRLTVLVSTANAAPVAVWHSGYIEGTTKGGWEKIELGLEEWKGKTIRLEFVFDSYDASKNAFGGATIDALTVAVTCDGTSQCFNDGDCPDDGDPCTIESCNANLCETSPSEAPECCEPSSLLDDTFDVGASGSLGSFTVQAFACASGDLSAECTASAAAPVKWQVAAGQPHSAPFALYFGNPTSGSYDDAGKRVRGTATTAKFKLDEGAGASLDLWTWADIEPWNEVVAYLDAYSIVVVDAEGTETIVWDKSALGGDDGQYAEWVHVEVSLSAWAGQEITVRLDFDSADGVGNKGAGIYVDDVKVIQLCE